MPTYKQRLIRPGHRIMFREKSAPIRGVSKRRLYRYNGGDWKPDDGTSDLAFVSQDNGVNIVWAATWPRKRDDQPDHPNELARLSAHAFSKEMFGGQAYEFEQKALNVSREPGTRKVRS